MVHSCVAYGCTQKFEKGSSVSFHCFPADENMRNIWTNELRRKNFIPSKHSKVCSKHFRPECFDNEAFGLGRKLKPDAVPTIFNFPPHLLSKLKKKLPPLQRVRQDITCILSNTTDENRELPAKRPRPFRKTYLGDFTEETAKSPTKFLAFMQIAKKKLKDTQKDLRLSRQRFRRTLQKLTTAEAQLKLFQQEFIIEIGADTFESGADTFESGADIFESSKISSKPGMEVHQKSQVSRPCFVCDELAGKDGVSLRFGLTSCSSTALPTKIGQLMGDNFMIVVTDVDVLCKRCSALLNHLDKLEQDMNVVKKALTGYLKKKYHLSEDLQSTTNGAENQELTLQDLKQLDLSLDQNAKTSDVDEFDKENGFSSVKIENAAPVTEDFCGSDREHAMNEKPGRKNADGVYHKTGESSEAANKKAEKRPQIDEMTVKRVKVAKSSSDDVTIYRCMSCKFKSPRMDQFMQHLKVHPKKTYYKCSECGKHFEKKEDARNHIESVHKFSDADCEDDMQEDVDEPETKKLYECATCGYEDSDKEEYENHLLSHEPVKFHECKICAKKFRSKQFLQKHVANHRLFKCGVCGKIFKIKADLLLHFKVHKSDRKPVSEGVGPELQKSSPGGGIVAVAKSSASEMPKTQLREDFDKVEQMLEIMHSEAPKLHVDDQKDLEGEKLYVQSDECNTWDENATDQNWDITNESESHVEAEVTENNLQENIAVRTIDIIEDKMDLSAAAAAAVAAADTEEAPENDAKDKHSDTASLPPTIYNEDDESRLQAEGSSATEDAIDDSMTDGIDHISGMQLSEILKNKTESICDEMKMHCTNESSLPFQVDVVADDSEKFEGTSTQKPPVQESPVCISNSSTNENLASMCIPNKEESLDSIKISSTNENLGSSLTLATEENFKCSDIPVIGNSVGYIEVPAAEANFESTNIPATDENFECKKENVENKEENFECIEVPATEEHLKCLDISGTEEHRECIEIPAMEANLECIEIPATEENVECIEFTAMEENMECVEISAMEENLEYIEIPATEENMECIEIPATEENMECIEIPATEENLECIEIPATEENLEYIEIPATEENLKCIEEIPTSEDYLGCIEIPATEENLECLAASNAEENFEFIEIPIKDENLYGFENPLTEMYCKEVQKPFTENGFESIQNSLLEEYHESSQNSSVEGNPRVKKPSEKVHVCSVCGFKTAIENKLKRHFRTHVVIENKFYECHICKKLLKTEGSLNRHLSQHSLNEKHEACTLCSEHFEDTFSLKQHMEIEHSFSHQCSYCDQVFPNKKLYLLHEKTHPERLCYKCDKCEDAFETEIKLKTHLINVHGDSSYELGSVRVFKCDQCGKVLTTQQNLRRHIVNQHTVPSVFKCSVCSVTFSEQWQLRQHTVKQHPVDIRCSYCKNAFPSEEACREHEQTHHSIPFVCEACGKGFTSQVALEKHEVEMHRDEPNCKICSKFIPDPGKLYNHERRHSRLKKKFVCAVCNRSFMTRSGVAHHMSLHTGKYPYYCEVCGKGVHSPMLLEEHRASHTKEIRHICDLCGRMFSSSSTYRMHRVWHDNPLPYKCDICGQRFKHTSILSVHKRRTHTGERPYKCPYCPYSFAVGSTMKKHIILHTKQFPYVCEHCNKGFTTRLKYVNHKKSIHKDFSAPPLKRKCEYKMVLRPEELMKQAKSEK